MARRGAEDGLREAELREMDAARRATEEEGVALVRATPAPRSPTHLSAHAVAETSLGFDVAALRECGVAVLWWDGSALEPGCRADLQSYAVGVGTPGGVSDVGTAWESSEDEGEADR